MPVYPFGYTIISGKQDQGTTVSNILNSDPLAGISGLWTNSGGSSPVGLYTDVACTTPVTGAAQAIAGWKDERTGMIIATQSDASKRPLSAIIGTKLVMLCDGIDDGMITEVNLVNPFSLAVAGAVTAASNTNRLIQSRDNNRLISLARFANAVFNGGAVLDDTASITLAAPAVAVLTVGATSSCFVNGVNHTDNSGVLGDWGRIGIMSEGTNPEPPTGYITGLFWKVGGEWTPTEKAAIAAFALTINPP